MIWFRNLFLLGFLGALIDGCSNGSVVLTPTGIARPSPAPSSTVTASPTSSTPAATPTATSSASHGASPSASPTASLSASPTGSPSASPTAFPSASPTASPSASPTASASPSPSPSPSATPEGELFVADRNAGGLLGFNTTQSGNVAPVTVIAGSNTDLSNPTSLAFNLNADELYTANDSSNTEVAFRPIENGNVPPDYILASTNRLESEGVAVDSVGLTYISSYSTNEIDIFAPSAMATATPAATIMGSNTMLNSPGNMAIDSSGMLYVVNYNVAAIYAFANAANNAEINGANLPPTAIISGSNTKLSQPFALTFDSQGHLLVADRGGSILSFDTSSLSSANGATENLTPVNVISGVMTDLTQPSGIAVDSSGDIWVSDNGNPQILEFAPGASGNIGPIDRIIGSTTVNNTMLSNPFDIVFVPSNVVDQVSKGRRAIRGIGRAQR